eukprot:jgi/Picre1/33621/NNA_001101.t1
MYSKFGECAQQRNTFAFADRQHAQMSKLACVERGYFSDPFVHLFVKPSDAMRARSRGSCEEKDPGGQSADRQGGFVLLGGCGCETRGGLYENFEGYMWDTGGSPTLFLAECVLVYMELSFSNALLGQVSHSFPESLCIVYEQVNPNDAFGKQMMINLSARGCPLKGIVSSLEEQKQRMKCCGWQHVMCEDMLSLFNRGIPREEIQRINRIEMLDEEEEWNLLLQHYCITCAQNTSDSHSLVDFSLK